MQCSAPSAPCLGRLPPAAIPQPWLLALRPRHRTLAAVPTMGAHARPLSQARAKASRIATCGHWHWGGMQHGSKAQPCRSYSAYAPSGLLGGATASCRGATARCLARPRPPQLRSCSGLHPRPFSRRAPPRLRLRSPPALSVRLAQALPRSQFAAARLRRPLVSGPRLCRPKPPPPATRLPLRPPLPRDAPAHRRPGLRFNRLAPPFLTVSGLVLHVTMTYVLCDSCGLPPCATPGAMLQREPSLKE